MDSFTETSFSALVVLGRVMISITSALVTTNADVMVVKLLPVRLECVTTKAVL